MEFTNTKNGDKLVVAVAGRLDAVTAPEFDTQCKSWLNDGENKIIADLSNLEYISSAGLRSILSAAKQLKTAKGEITFCGLNGMVEEVFTVSGFASMFAMYPTLDDALAG
ncbi:STAS domain-containing protein [uncultured Pseudodesulfovibrio sp.]|uniref:STAS domain-containing protein n=1 Tax=uncultured Pseudodesulfovibrio sp. TaxID=2035858 RepID=UPI0029C623BE|nr:STAS domain-containing protein [uncultured Pseudodesulfovibrio sp.]